MVGAAHVLGPGLGEDFLHREIAVGADWSWEEDKVEMLHEIYSVVEKWRGEEKQSGKVRLLKRRRDKGNGLVFICYIKVQEGSRQTTARSL